MSEEIFKIRDEEDNELVLFDDSYNAIRIIINQDDENIWVTLSKSGVDNLIKILSVLVKDLEDETNKSNT